MTQCSKCWRPIDESQAHLSAMRADRATPACKDCVTTELSAWANTSKLKPTGAAHSDKLLRARLRLARAVQNDIHGGEQ